MEVIIAIPFLLIPLMLPLTTGFMAKSFGRKFWPWFLAGIPLPFIANIILLCLPDKSKLNKTAAPDTTHGSWTNDDDLNQIKNNERSLNTTF